MELTETRSVTTTTTPAPLAWLDSPEAIRKEVHRRLAIAKVTAINLALGLGELEAAVTGRKAVHDLVRKTSPFCLKLLRSNGGLPNNAQMAALAEFYALVDSEKLRRVQEEAKSPRVLSDVQIFEKLAALIPANQVLLAALRDIQAALDAGDGRPEEARDLDAICKAHEVVSNCEILKATYEISWCALRLARAEEK